MQIARNKLRQIILEEVQVRLLDLYITEEFKRIFEEEGKEAEDEDLQAYKQAAADELGSYAKKGLIPMALAAALMGYLGQETTSYSDTKAAVNQARTQANIDAANTDDAQFDELVDQLNNQYAFRWGKGDDSVVHAPGSDGKVTVLPPSYSVMVKVMQDKKAIQRYGELDLDLGIDHERQYKGDYEANIDNFFKKHQGDFIDAMNVLSAHDELQVVPGSGTEEQIIMLDPNKITGDYYLPELGMTAEDYYNYQYGEYMGSGEAAALDLPDEEMTIVPDTDTELEPDLIRRTKERAGNVKENKQAQ